MEFRGATIIHILNVVDKQGGVDMVRGEFLVWKSHF